MRKEISGLNLKTLIRSLIFLFLLPIIGCSSIPKFPIQSELLSEPVDTTVDSEIARYYLKSYLKGYRLRPDFDYRIRQLYQSQGDSLPDRDRLTYISQQFSTDFAALFFADYLLREERNRHTQEIFQRFLDSDKSELYTAPPHFTSYLILFVPGWNYIDNGYSTGSDLALPRKLITALGVENHLVLTPANGSVQASAEILAEAIDRFSQRNKKIIIVGASAAGPAIHLALGQRPSTREISSVAAWINLGGILKGSPLVDYFEHWPQKGLMKLVLWYKGWKHEDIMSMSSKVSRQRFKQLKLDPELLIINYLALSLSGNLSHLSKYKYPLIKNLGPNDGLTLLPDAIAPNSATLISVNSDHYFGEDSRIDDKTIAVLKTVIYFLEQKSRPRKASVYAAER